VAALIHENPAQSAGFLRETAGGPAIQGKGLVCYHYAVAKFPLTVA